MPNAIWDWMKSKGDIPMNRQHYFDAAGLSNDGHDWRLPLPAEMEAELPKEIKIGRRIVEK